MRKLLITLLLLSVLAFSVGAWGVASAPPPDGSIHFQILYAGTPDAYGNQILNVSLDQDLGGAWVRRGIITETNYTGSDTLTGYYNQSCLFTVWTRLNYTFVSSSSAALAGSRAYIRIGSVVAFTEMDAVEVELITQDQGWVVKHTYEWDIEGYPEITTYTVSLRFSSIGSVDHLLQNENDLTEYNTGTFDRGNTIASGQPGDNALNYPCGYWYTTVGQNGHFYDAGFRPFHNAYAVTVEIWFMIIQGSGSGSGLPSQDGHTFYLLSQYVSWDNNLHIWITTGDIVQGRIGNGATGTNINTNTAVDLFQLYHVVFTWKSGDKPAIYLNNSVTLGGANITGPVSANADLYLNKRSSGLADYGNFVFFDVAIWNRSLSSTEVALEYAAGPEGGFQYATQINNSWSFNEYSSGIYAKTEGTLHDGLGTFGVRETWTFYGEFTTLALTLAPNPLLYPEVYIWFGGWAMVPLGVAYAKIRGANNPDEKPLHWGIGFIILMLGAAIVISGV